VSIEIRNAIPEAGLLTLDSEQRDAVGDDNTTLFEASNDTEDRYNSIVRQDWKLTEYRANPVVLDSHNPYRVVGRAVEAKVPRTGDDAGKLMIRVEWNLQSPDPALAAVGHQHLNGFRKAGSVAWQYGKVTQRDKLPTDHVAFKQKEKRVLAYGDYVYEYESAGLYYEQNALREFSSVSVPGNATALQRHYLAHIGAQDPEDIAARLRAAQDTVPRAVGADLASMAQDPANRAALLTLLWPDLVDRMRTDAEARRVLRAILEAGPPAPPPAAVAAPTPSLASLVLCRLQEAP
jgi:hypothetical protein